MTSFIFLDFFITWTNTETFTVVRNKEIGEFVEFEKGGG
jgi:hypothetical protein